MADDDLPNFETFAKQQLWYALMSLFVEKNNAEQRVPHTTISRRFPSLLVISRIVAAVIGGYALATLLPLALVGLLPISRADAVMSSLLLSFSVYVAAILWAFSAKCAWQVWAGLLLSSALAGLLLVIQRGLL